MKIKINYLFIIVVLCSFIGCKDNNITKENKRNSDLLALESQKTQSKTIEHFEENPSYFIREIDINNDGINDKIVSSEKHEGNELYFFQKNGKTYDLVLESINFSEDGGRIIKDILPIKNDKEVLKISTYFPDGGNDKASYFVSLENGKWILSKTLFEISDWKDDYTKIYLCEVAQNIVLSELIFEKGVKLLKHLPEEQERETLCNVKYDFEDSINDFIKRFSGNNSNIYNEINRYKALLSKFRISKENIREYNDIAYYLEQSGAYKEAIFLLKKITKEFPDRTVAYINLGDAYWGLGDKEKAKKAYKTYINQMKKSGKETTIPKTILDRVKENNRTTRVN